MVLKKKSNYIDPVHGDIPYTDHEDILIAHPIYQRLKKIKQLGTVYLVYPSSTHTRYSHSLGVMHVTGQLFNSIFNDVIASDNYSKVQKDLDELYKCVRISGLLHDLGHGPYGHQFESIFKGLKVSDLKNDLMKPLDWVYQKKKEDYSNQSLKHEHYSYALISVILNETNLNSHYSARDICCLLDSNFEPSRKFSELLERVSEHIGGGSKDSLLGVLKAILSSDIDADRIDYLQRDSLSCGIKISAIDFNHILNSIQINSDKNGEFFIELKKNAISSIDQVLISRKMMFDRVYLHWEHCYYGDLLINCIKKLNITSRVEKLTSSWREYVFANDDQVDESIRIYIKSIKNVKEISDDNLKALLYFYRIKPKKHFQSLYFSSEHKEKKGELLEKYSQSLFEILPIPLKKFTSLARDLNSDKDSILRINLLNDGDFVVYNKASDIFKSNLWIQIKERATVVDSLSEIKIKKLDEIEKIHSSLFLDVTAKKKDVG